MKGEALKVCDPAAPLIICGAQPRFFLPLTQRQLASRVRASPPLTPLCPTTTPDLLQPDSRADTCSKSKPTQNLWNSNADSLPRLKQFPRKSPSPQAAAPGPALVPSRVSASLQKTTHAAALAQNNNQRQIPVNKAPIMVGVSNICSSLF